MMCKCVYIAVSILFLIRIGGVRMDRGTSVTAYRMQKYPGDPLDKK